MFMHKLDISSISFYMLYSATFTGVWDCAGNKKKVHTGKMALKTTNKSNLTIHIQCHIYMVIHKLFGRKCYSQQYLSHLFELSQLFIQISISVVIVNGEYFCNKSGDGIH